MPRKTRRRLAARPPTIASLQRDLDAIVSIIERNTARISRLEDVFALHVRQRAEVEDALAEVRAQLRKRNA